MSSGNEHQASASNSPPVAAGQRPAAVPPEGELQHLSAHWWWFLVLGITLVVCGMIAFMYPVITSLSVVAVFGTILLIAGVANIIGAFWAGKWSGFLIEVLVGLFYVVLGMMVSERPGAAATAFTMLVAAVLIVAGLARIVVALVLRLPQWGWFLLNGVVTLVCGVVIYRHFPENVFWVIGLLVGLEMMFHGWTWIMIALGIREIKDSPAAASAK